MKRIQPHIICGVGDVARYVLMVVLALQLPGGAVGCVLYLDAGLG